MRHPNLQSRRRRTTAPRTAPGPETCEGQPGAAPRGESPADAREWAVTDVDFWDAFEPDVFGGPEAEPQPEHGDFCYEPDDPDWEGLWR